MLLYARTNIASYARTTGQIAPSFALYRAVYHARKTSLNSPIFCPYSHTSTAPTADLRRTLPSALTTPDAVFFQHRCRASVASQATSRCLAWRRPPQTSALPCALARACVHAHVCAHRAKPRTKPNPHLHALCVATGGSSHLHIGIKKIKIFSIFFKKPLDILCT